jgi:cell wall-associated NlpC family hydrolase
LAAFTLLLCLACVVGVLAFTAGSADAKPRRAVKSHHVRHPHRRRPLRRHRARRHAVRRRHATRVTAERRGRDRVVEAAWRAVGVPYRWGGSSPSSGFDCSGLARWVYGHVGIALPHYSVGQWSYGRRVARRALVPGDLLFFASLGHVGIYVGRGAFIHAPHAGARVRLEHLSGWFASSFVGARRFRLR